MQHLNPYRFYELAAKLHGLFSTMHQNRVSAMFGPLTEAQTTLDAMIKGDPIQLETSLDDATKLLNRVANIFSKYYIDPNSKQLKTPTGEDKIDPHEMAALMAQVEKFEHAFAADLNRAATYAATKRGIYSTYDLIENAYRTFPDSLLKIIAKPAQDEFGNAGRALAFGMGSAAAMHLLRAVEIVLKQYYELYSGTTVAKAERGYAIYMKKLAAMAEDDNASFRPDKRLLQMLAQIKEHYRNPLTTPEFNISIDQATSLFGLSCAIITMMAEQIAAQKSASSSVQAASAALEEVNADIDADDSQIAKAG